MQKKLIAVAVVSALAVPTLALADSANVTISGLIKSGLESYQLDMGHAKEQRVSDQSSRVIFAGSEDLGMGGLKGWFQVDSRLSTDLGSTPQNGTWGAYSTGFGNGNTGLGLSGDFGKLTVGRWDLHYNEFGTIESNRAGSLQTYLGAGPVTQLNGSQFANGTRTPNVFMYDTANWGGFTGRLAYSTSFAAASAPNEGNTTTSADNGGGKAINLALRYSGFGLTAGLSHWDAKIENRNTSSTANSVAAVGYGSFDQKADRVWVGYTAPFGLKVGVGYDKSKAAVVNGLTATTATDAERKAFLVPISYTFGNNAFYVTYAKLKSSNDQVIAAAGGTDGAKALSVGYDYAFSKRTFVGVYYTKLDNDPFGSYDLFNVSSATGGANGATATAANVTGGVGESVKQIYLGLAHSF